MRKSTLRRAAKVGSLVILCFVEAGFAQPVRAQQTFHSSENGYRITFPDGWESVHWQDVKMRIDILRKNPAARNLQWEAVYQPGYGRDSFTLPYVILQVAPYNAGQLSEAELQKAVSSMTGNNFKSAMAPTGSPAIDDAMAGAAVGVPQYDAVRHVLSQRLEMDTPQEGHVSALIVSHFGRSALVSVMCYDHHYTFDGSRPTFDEICNSFQFDRSSAFVPRHGLFDGLGGGAMRGAVFGAMAGGIIGAIAFAIRRKKKLTMRPRF